MTGLAGAEDSATLDIRRRMDCGEGEVQILVDSVNVAQGGDFELLLPPGDYTLVASAAGRPTLEYAVTVTADQDTVQEVIFDNPV